tara:strand:+ start:389 stop:526 length:138 start_codon:yes stop_codon:yes gene_type:complete
MDVGLSGIVMEAVVHLSFAVKTVVWPLLLKIVFLLVLFITFTQQG